LLRDSGSAMTHPASPASSSSPGQSTVDSNQRPVQTAIHGARRGLAPDVPLEIRRRAGREAKATTGALVAFSRSAPMCRYSVAQHGQVIFFFFFLGGAGAGQERPCHFVLLPIVVRDRAVDDREEPRPIAAMPRGSSATGRPRVPSGNVTSARHRGERLVGRGRAPARVGPRFLVRGVPTPV